MKLLNRTTFFRFLLIAVVLYTILGAWGLRPGKKQTAASKPGTSIEFAGFTWFAKISVGAKELALRNKTKFLNGGLPESELEFLINGRFLEENLPIEAFLAPSTPAIEQRALILAQIILAHHFTLNEKVAELIEIYKGLDGDIRSALFRFIEKTYASDPSSFSVELSPPFLSATESFSTDLQHLGWMAKLLELDYETTREAPYLNDLQSTLTQETTQKTLLFLVSIVVFVVAITVAVIAFLVLAGLLLLRKLRFHFEACSIEPERLFETFTLYLVVLNLTVLGTSSLFRDGNLTDILKFNIILSCIPVAVLLWPLIHGHTARATSASIGARFKGLWGTLKNIALGPISFVAAWPIFFVVLPLYQFILTTVGHDVSEGEHPAVPMVLGAEDPSAFLYFFLLAAVIAPIVEEVMFRGVFYGWLRSRYGILLSMFLCGLVFAAIHPQGPVGVLPLTCIGMGLCFLREWRGSLITPIIAHGCLNGTIFLILFQLR